MCCHKPNRTPRACLSDESRPPHTQGRLRNQIVLLRHTHRFLRVFPWLAHVQRYAGGWSTERKLSPAGRAPWFSCGTRIGRRAVPAHRCRSEAGPRRQPVYTAKLAGWRVRLCKCAPHRLGLCWRGQTWKLREAAAAEPTAAMGSTPSAPCGGDRMDPATDLSHHPPRGSGRSARASTRVARPHAQAPAPAPYEAEAPVLALKKGQLVDLITVRSSPHWIPALVTDVSDGGWRVCVTAFEVRSRGGYKYYNLDLGSSNDCNCMSPLGECSLGRLVARQLPVALRSGCGGARFCAACVRLGRAPPRPALFPMGAAVSVTAVHPRAADVASQARTPA